MAKLALVTGGSGYFGSLLVERLRSRGYRVRILDLNPLDSASDGIESVLGDIRDAAAVRDAVRDVDVIHHNVAQVPLAKDRHLFQSVNVDGLKNLLEAAAERVGKVVYTSSSAVYGVPAKNPVRESDDPKPREAYGKAKLEGEVLCRRFNVERGLDISIVRPRTILGHGRLGIFQILFEWIYQGSNVPVLGKGDNLYQFVHSDDLAEACLLAGERAGSSAYNCGAERFGTMREALEALCRHAGTGSKVKSVPFRAAVLGMKITSALGLSPLGDYHALMYGRSMYFDISKAKSELGWSPRYSSDEMLAQSYDWYIANRRRLLDEAAHGTVASPHRSAVKQRILGLVPRLL